MTVRGGLKRRRAWAVVVMAVAMMAVASSACGGDDESPDVPASPTTQSAPTATTLPPATIAVRFQEGEVVGGAQKVTVERGNTVNLVVSADVADEVHVHGYDMTAELTPDTPVALTFQADSGGVYEVELEELGETLVTLQVEG